MTTRRHYCDDEIFTFCDDVFENTLVLLFVEVYVLVDVLPSDSALLDTVTFVVVPSPLTMVFCVVPFCGTSTAWLLTVTVVLIFVSDGCDVWSVVSTSAAGGWSCVVVVVESVACWPSVSTLRSVCVVTSARAVTKLSIVTTTTDATIKNKGALRCATKARTAIGCGTDVHWCI